MTAAMAAPFAPDSLTPPDQRRWSGPLLLALVAHALLVAALTWGISWNKTTPNVVAQAELWSAMPRTAAPRLVEEAPEPPPPPPPEPPAPAKPPAPPTPPQPAPDPVAEQREADIALAQKKKREQEQREQAEAARMKAEKAAKDKAERAEKERLARLKLEREQAEREKAEKAAREAKAKEDAQKLARQKAEQKAEQKAAQQKADQAKADADKKAQQAELARQRAENLKRMAGLAGATGGPGSTGTDTHSSGPSAGYAGRIVGAVRPNIVFTDTPPGNPAADVEVRTLPDGTIASRRIVKSSGLPAWDEAVLKALDRTAKLPRDTDGQVPGTLLITFRLRD